MNMQQNALGAGRPVRPRHASPRPERVPFAIPSPNRPLRPREAPRADDELEPSTSPATPLVGAPVGVEIGEDWPAVRAYATRIQNFSRSLLDDAQQQIVYVDPVAALEAAAKWGTDEELEAARELAVRAKKRGPKQSAADVTWFAQFRAFRLVFEQWLDQVTSVSPGMQAKDAWSKNADFEKQLRTLITSYLLLSGTKVSQPLPETLETDDGKPAKSLLDAAASVAGALGSGASMLGIGAAIGIGALVLLRR